MPNPALLEAAKAVSQFLRGRDRAEPGRKRKEYFERLLAEAVLRYLRRTKAAFVAQMGMVHPGRKAYGGQVDPELEADLSRILTQAAQDGYLLLTANAAIGADTAVGLQTSTAWAQAYARDLAMGIAGTTATQIQSAVNAFASTPGLTIGDVANSILGPSVTLPRALNIATTEVTRAYSEAAQVSGQQWKDLGVSVYKSWSTNNDDRVCPICGPLNQQEILADAKFKGAKGAEIEGPPAHPRCRCWLMVYPKA